jgi:hypothetical protein
VLKRNPVWSDRRYACGSHDQHHPVVPAGTPRRVREGRLDVQVKARGLGPRLQFGRPDQERPAEGGVGLVDSTARHGGPLWRGGRRVGPERAVPRHCHERLDTHGTCFTPLIGPAPAQLATPHRARRSRTVTRYGISADRKSSNACWIASSSSCGVRARRRC